MRASSSVLLERASNVKWESLTPVKCAEVDVVGPRPERARRVSQETSTPTDTVIALVREPLPVCAS